MQTNETKLNPLCHYLKCHHFRAQFTLWVTESKQFNRPGYTTHNQHMLRILWASVYRFRSACQHIETFPQTRWQNYGWYAWKKTLPRLLRLHAPEHPARSLIISAITRQTPMQTCASLTACEVSNFIKHKFRVCEYCYGLLITSQKGKAAYSC